MASAIRLDHRLCSNRSDSRRTSASPEGQNNGRRVLYSVRSGIYSGVVDHGWVFSEAGGAQGEGKRFRRYKE